MISKSLASRTGVPDLNQGPSRDYVELHGLGRSSTVKPFLEVAQTDVVSVVDHAYSIPYTYRSLSGGHNGMFKFITSVSIRHILGSTELCLIRKYLIYNKILDILILIT